MKSLFKNQKGFSAVESVLAILVVAIVAGIGIYVLTRSDAATGVTYFKGHCKDADHLRAVAYNGGDLVQPAEVVIREQQATNTEQCVNDTGYRGVIYTFVVNGNEGMNMKPDGARYVQSQFASYASRGANVELDHTTGGNFMEFRNFTGAAAGKIATSLAGFLNITPPPDNNPPPDPDHVIYFRGICRVATDLKAVAAGAGTQVKAGDVSIKVQQATSAYRCSNDTTYRGAIYTFVINGKDGLSMKPNGGSYVQNQFASFASRDASVQLNRVSGSEVTEYRTFTSAAAKKVADALASHGL